LTGALAAAWLSAALLASSPVDGHEAGRDVTRILAQERYLFCAEGNEYQPTTDDLRWCPLGDQVAARCPGYTAVCGRRSPSMFGDMPIGEGEGESEEQQPGQANTDAYEEREPLQLPDLGIFAKLLMWLLLIGGALAIVVVIVKNLVRDRDDDQPELEAEPDAGESLIAARAAAMRVVETDVQRLLARAEQAAARGDHEAAINDVYAALLRRLEGEQLISVERFKTNGDYLGELRSHALRDGVRSRPPLRDEVREIVRDVEQVQFGAAAADASRYASVRNKVLAVVGRAALSLALLLGGGVLLGCPLLPDPDALPDSAALAGLGTGPSGQRAVAELLLLNDIEARHRTRSIEQLTGVDGAIILLDDVELLDADWDTLQTWVEEHGGTLVIATGKEFPRELGIDYEVIDSAATKLEPGASHSSFDRLTVAAPAGRVLGLRTGAVGRTERLLLRDPGWEFRQQDLPYVVRRSLGKGEVVVFAEPDMLTNVGITVADNAAFLINLLASREIDEVEFVNAYTGAGPDDPFESVGNAKLGGLFLQILLFLALLYAAVGIPFARLRDLEQQARRSFVEHVRTLGQRYAQARAARYVAGLYSAWALDRLRDRVLPGNARGLHPLAQAIAARTGRDEASVMQLLVHAHDLRDNSQHSTRGTPADLELMRLLAKLLDETSNTRS